MTNAVTKDTVAKIAAKVYDFIKMAGVDRDAGKRLSPEFWQEFVKMSQRLGANPEDIAAVLMAESAFDPGATAVRNGRTVAKGLNQLTLATLPAIGMSRQTWNTMEHMSGIDQLEWIEKYYRLAGKLGGIQDWASATQLYIANFAPAFLSKAVDPNAVLYNKHRADGSLNPAYTQNRGLDRQGRGHIRVSDLAKSVSHGIPQYVRDAIKTAQGGGSQVIHSPKEVDSLIGRLYADEGRLTKIVKNSILEEKLPTSDVLVCISGDNQYNKLEYARLVSSLLRQFIQATAAVCADEDEVEIQCSALGSEKLVVGAVQEICGVAMSGMNKHMKSGVSVMVLSGLLSKHSAVEEDMLIKNRRLFNMNRMLNG
jgi:hypothetical protein